MFCRNKLLLFLVMLQFCSLTLFGFTFSGQGASYPYKLYQQTFKDYYKSKKTTVNYNPTSSRDGFFSIQDQRVDFAGVDLFVSDELMETLPSPHKLLHIPTCLSGIGMAYHLKGVSSLKLSASLLSKIYRGKITTWNHPDIVAVNPGITLPDLNIVLIRRAGGSGSSFIFTQYLTIMDSIWRDTIGTTATLQPFNSLAVDTSSSMGKMISQVNGSIGYIGYGFKHDFSLSFAHIENLSGNFIEPTLDSISASAEIEIPEDARVFCTSTPSEYGYPLSSFSWIIFYQEQHYAKRSKAFVKQFKHFLSFMIDNSVNHSQIGYAKLPQNVKVRSKSILEKITYKGKPL
ncbi:phosphate ABC transporter substrate-binding protein PstS [Candidatus Marinamargulisbacteria bacterium SCGC AG-343-D04]|nr:phosphate ABC transporter substrate-binding protein PstS [Candidatus Marinamargulisbacteria bacterium SCGC AG-343-D04]